MPRFLDLPSFILFAPVLIFTLILPDILDTSAITSNEIGVFTQCLSLPVSELNDDLKPTWLHVKR